MFHSLFLSVHHGVAVYSAKLCSQSFACATSLRRDQCGALMAAAFFGILQPRAFADVCAHACRVGDEYDAAPILDLRVFLGAPVHHRCTSC